MNLWSIFITGLTTGGLTCLAMQGGLLASVIANEKKTEVPTNKLKKNRLNTTLDSLDILPVAIFLGAKLISHVLIGFLLGLIGESVAISTPVQLLFQLAAGLFMFATAMNLLNVHPIFRFVSFQPPKKIQRFIRQITKQDTPDSLIKSLTAPALLGFLTVFIPCGVTQAMELLALSSGSAIWRALIMAAFVIGTMPIFSFVGIATARLSEQAHARFSKIAAALLIIMAIYGINGVLLVLNSPVTLQSITYPVTYFFSSERFAETAMPQVENGQQQITIQAKSYGYEPKYIQVKKGIPVALTVHSFETYSCSLGFQLPEFGISLLLDATDSQSAVFTPTKTGRYTYTCSMGMYTGILEVVN